MGLPVVGLYDGPVVEFYGGGWEERGGLGERLARRRNPRRTDPPSSFPPFPLPPPHPPPPQVPATGWPDRRKFIRRAGPPAVGTHDGLIRSSRSSPTILSRSRSRRLPVVDPYGGRAAPAVGAYNRPASPPQEPAADWPALFLLLSPFPPPQVPTAEEEESMGRERKERERLPVVGLYGGRAGPSQVPATGRPARPREL